MNTLDAAFFNAVRNSLFGGALNQKQVDSLNALCGAWRAWGDGDDRKLAYVLATAKHESDDFRTMTEYASGRKYEGRKDLGNTEPGDGMKFKGRGFVQITGRRNYADWSRRTGRDLLKTPELATGPDIAARICVEGMMLGTFTGRKLADYINNDECDYYQARRIVNGLDKADLIAGYAKKFQQALRAD